MNLESTTARQKNFDRYDYKHHGDIYYCYDGCDYVWWGKGGRHDLAMHHNGRFDDCFIDHDHCDHDHDCKHDRDCKRDYENQKFVWGLAEEAAEVNGRDYLPYNKLHHYNDYELIYYINDVTIDNEEVLVEYGANGTAAGTYEYGNERLSVEYANHAKEYYLYNGTGNVTQTTAQNGSLYLRYTYDAFGNITSIRAPFAVDTDDINRYTYNGEDYDYTTGLQYLRARYYNTSTGSFISQDTYLGQIISPLSQNRYTYCHNNPVMYDDPSGHWIILGLVIAGFVIGTAGAVTYYSADSVAGDAEEEYYTALQEYKNAIKELEQARNNINNIFGSSIDKMASGQGVDISSTYLELQVEYINYASAYIKACSTTDELNESAEKFNAANQWKGIGASVALIGTGMMAMGFAPALPAAFTAMGYPVLEGTLASEALIFFGGATGMMTSLYGVSDLTESVTGFNPVLEVAYSGDVQAYGQDEQMFLYASLLMSFLGVYGEYVSQLGSNQYATNSTAPVESNVDSSSRFELPSQGS